MYLLVFMTSTLFIATSSLKYNRFHFSYQDEESLTICIEKSEHLEEVKKLRGYDFVHIFADFAAELLAGRVNKDLGFLKSIIESFKNEPYNFPSTSTGNFWNIELKDALMDALIHCSDDFDFEKCSDPYHIANRRLVPEFESERDQPEITRLVNLGAVSFSENLKSMAATPYGFIVLMTFADDFVITIANAYKSSNSNANDVRNEVMRTWNIRAVNYCPLFRYYYDARSRDVYTCGCVNFDRYGTKSWKTLLQKVKPEKLSSVVQLFQSHLLEGRGDDIYNRYVTEGMREFERELELLMIQKYRITIFIYELRVRGILSDQTEVIDYDFLDRIPQSLWELLYNDNAYIAHLTSIREFLLLFLEFNHLEEEMILFLNSEVNFRSLRLVSHAESLVYDFPTGIYAAYVSATHINATTSANDTTTTTTIRPKSKKPFHSEAKNFLFNYLNSKSTGNRNHKSSPDGSHGSDGTMNTRSFDSGSNRNVKSVSFNAAREEVDCNTNLHSKDETIYLRGAISLYMKSRHFRLSDL